MLDTIYNSYVLYLFPTLLFSLIVFSWTWLIPRTKTIWFWMPFLVSQALSFLLVKTFISHTNKGDGIALVFLVIPTLVILSLVLGTAIALLFAKYKRRKDGIEIKRYSGLKTRILQAIAFVGFAWAIMSTVIQFQYQAIKREFYDKSYDDARLEELWHGPYIKNSRKLGYEFTRLTLPDSIFPDVILTAYSKGWIEFKYGDRNSKRLDDETRSQLMLMAIERNDNTALKTLAGTHSTPCDWASNFVAPHTQNSEALMAATRQYWCETYIASEQEKINSDKSIFDPVVLAAELQKMRHSYNPISYYYKFLNATPIADMISIQSLQTLAGMPMFVSGPHSVENGFDQRNEKQFGQYNPKFVDWFFNELFMSDSSGLKLHINQQLYDEKLRDLSRIYYLTYIKLEQSGVLKIWQADYAGKLARGESVAGYYFQFERILSEYNIETYSAAHATTFWIRRAIDGTDKNFYNGLEKVLAHYDPIVLQYARSWQDTNTITRQQNKILFGYVKSRDENKITLSFKAPAGILNEMSVVFEGNKPGEPVWLYHQKLGLIKASWLSHKSDIETQSEPSIEVTLKSPLLQFRHFDHGITYIALLNTSVVVQNWLYAPMTLQEIASYNQIIKELEVEGYYVFDQDSILNKVKVINGPDYLLVRYAIPMKQEPGGPEPQVPFYRIYVKDNNGNWKLLQQGQARMILPYIVFDPQSAKSLPGFVPFTNQGSQTSGLLRVD